MNIKALFAATLVVAFGGAPAIAPATAAIIVRGAHADELPPPACSVVYLSDQTPATPIEDDQLYRTAGAIWPVFAAHPTLPAADDGWGLWAAPAVIFAGESAFKIDVYKPCGIARARQYTTNGFGPPESIASFGNNGPVFATEEGSTTVDCGTALILPACIDTNLPFTGTPAYVAVDANSQVYVSGEDTNTNQEVDQCAWPGFVCTTCETIVGPSVPGGLTVDENQHLIVNDELNATLYSYATGVGTCGAAPISTFVYGFPLSDHFTFTAITLWPGLGAGAEDYIVGAKEWTTFGGFCPHASFQCMNAKTVNYNPTTALIGPMAADHSPILPNQTPGTGIAVTPPGPF